MVETPAPTKPIVLRAPMTTDTTTKAVDDCQSSSFAPPSVDWLAGSWHVTHSTLPMWKSKRNVSITYKPHDRASPPKIDDVVSYQTLTSDKTKTIVGVDTMNGGNTLAWDWCGKGWLTIVSSHWEVLGYGDLDDGHRWAVTYFAKTLFTPAGIDVYSRKKVGLSDEILGQIKKALAQMENVGVKKLAGEIFEVMRD